MPEQPDEKTLIEQISFVAQANFYLKDLDEEAKEKLKHEALSLYNDKYGPQTGDFAYVETIHFYAKK